MPARLLNPQAYGNCTGPQPCRRTPGRRFLYWKVAGSSTSHPGAITLITLLCTLLALGWTLIQPKIYSATASGLVVATGEQDLASALAGNNLAQSKAVSYESLATSRPVAESTR